MSKKAKKAEHITRITATHRGEDERRKVEKDQLRNEIKDTDKKQEEVESQPKSETKSADQKPAEVKSQIESEVKSADKKSIESEVKDADKKREARIKLSKAEKKALKSQKKSEKKALKLKKKAGEEVSEKPVKEYFVLARPFVALGRYIRDSWAELRQVRWPNRKATWKMTLAVLIYCALMMALILLLDMLFSFLVGLMIEK